MWKRLTILVLWIAVAVPGHGDTPATNVGKKIGDFRLKDSAGKAVALADYRARKAVVVVFIGTQCPISNAYMPRLMELHRAYSPQGVQILAINANRQDTPDRVAEHVRVHHLEFPVLKDDDQAIADRFGARRSPEAFVLDPTGTIRYQGRIDDQFGTGFNRPKPLQRDLVAALDEVLAGKAVTQPTTKVFGCLIGRPAAAKQDGNVNYAKHIAPLLQKHCQECHRPGQIGPMPLLSYDEASSWAATIREVLEEERMPPWYADPRYGKFANDRRMPAGDKELLLRWISQGTPRGADRDLPPPKQFAKGWRIGTPDLILTMPRAYDVPEKAPGNGIPYKHFTVDPDFKEDRWIQCAEARADATSVVHHVLVFIVPPGKRFFPGNPATPTLCGTAPGDMPLILEPGLAKRVPKGSKLVFQMHYTPNGTAYKDRSSVGLIFAKSPPKQEVATLPIYNFRFKIRPGDDNYKVESNHTFSEDATLISFMPHMHLRGKDFSYEAIYPDGKTEMLLSVPRYSFNWQSVYRLAEPKKLPKGTKMHCVAHFDNSAKNLNNPDPTKSVFWGDQTWEEMMVGWLDYAFERKPDEAPPAPAKEAATPGKDGK